MKTPFYFIFIFTITVTVTSPLISGASDVIYDTAGNKLLKGVPYYITPLLRGSGGGLTLSRSTKDSCPLDVTQEPFQLSSGIPFTVTPIIIDESFIRSSYPISVEANVADPCKGSKILKVGTSAVAKTVTTGGEFNSPESCFQIVEDDMMPGLRSYQIQLCPFKCGLNSSTSLTCYNVGVAEDADGKRFLAQTDAVFPVVFENSFGKSVQSV
ncbi:hypothetical protein SSX86_017938 [Deinandra increscens subsp. villosa]|uniref:Uncharacterized protein n=1 Tax=Deinandra increscens subsp. villosa TaxID=3103831 RepID=A0AAP0GW67_9ASTR